MNTKGIVVLGMTAALVGACSSDENLDNNNGLKGDEAYVSLSISLPSSSRSMRAFSGYDQGTAAEYNVEKLKVVYFQKPSGISDGDYEKYTVLDSKDISKDALVWSVPPSSANGITTEATLPVQKVKSNVAAVLVLINPTSDSYTAETTFADVNKAMTVSDVSSLTTANGNANYFFMSNSPLSDGTTLVPVKAYTREEEAKANTKAVYVERAVAKVSFDKGGLTESNGNWSVDATGSYNGDKVTFTNWTLDVVNKKEYPVRKYNKDWNNWNANNTTVKRFLATKALTNGVYRTFWAIDPNYDTDGVPAYADGVVDKTNRNTTDNFSYVSDVATAMSASAYCTENTFDVNHMKQGETTRVIVKAQYQPQTNLEEGLQTSDFTAGQTWYRLGNSNKANNEEKLTEKVLTAVKTVTASATEVKLVADKVLAGEQDFTDDMFTVTDGTATDRSMTAAELAAVKASLGKLTAYKDGICYYVARIMHFGDDETPWKDGFDYTKSANDAVRQNYLGRYGIVRNNWYQLTINSVSAPGTPTIPIPSDTPDDEQNYYLQTTVKIMDWAVRKQGLEF